MGFPGRQRQSQSDQPLYGRSDCLGAAGQRRRRSEGRHRSAAGFSFLVQNQCCRSDQADFKTFRSHRRPPERDRRYDFPRDGHAFRMVPNDSGRPARCHAQQLRSDSGKLFFFVSDGSNGNCKRTDRRLRFHYALELSPSPACGQSGAGAGGGLHHGGKTQPTGSPECLCIYGDHAGNRRASRSFQSGPRGRIEGRLRPVVSSRCGYGVSHGFHEVRHCRGPGRRHNDQAGYAGTGREVPQCPARRRGYSHGGDERGVQLLFEFRANLHCPVPHDRPGAQTERNRRNGKGHRRIHGDGGCLYGRRLSGADGG